MIDYVESGIWTTHFKLDLEGRAMMEQEILDRFNECIVATEQLRAEYKHVVIEIPSGKSPIEHFEKGYQWTPRGDVLRCVISDGGPNEPIMHIDDRDLAWKDFGRLLTTYAGWGMRVIFVPDDETEVEPRIEVRESREDQQ